MNKLKIVSTCFFITTFLLTGCATKLIVSENKGKNKEVKTDPKAALEQRKQQLKAVDVEVGQLVNQALKEGDSAQKFLGNELYLKASASVIEGDYQTANIFFAHLMKLEPKDIYLKKRYAISLIRMGELDKSVGVLEELVKVDKDSEENVSLILAGVYGTLGKTDKAVEVYQKILAKDPSNEDACIFYSKALATEKDIKKAIKLLNKCSRHSKDKGIFDYYIGKLYVDQADLTNAKKSFSKAHKKQPSFGQAIMALGLIHEEMKENEQALKIYTKHLDQFPDDTTILTRMVQLLFNMKKFDQVISYAERLSDSEPDNLNLKVKLGVLYTEKQDYRKAVSIFKELLQHTPDNDNILYYVGAIYQELGMYDNAVTYYSRISDQSNLFEDSSMQIAKMLGAQSEKEFNDRRKTGQYTQKFLEHIQTMTAKIPKLKLEFKTLQAGFLEGIGDYDGAIQALNDAKDSEGFSDSYIFYLASLYEKKQDYDQSNKLVLELLDKDPKNAHAWNYLGYSLLERGIRLDLAHEYIVKALTIEPHDGYIRDSLGWYYYKVGKLESALTELLYASKHVGDDYSIQKHLTIVYASLKEFANAKKWAAKAISNTTSEKELEQLKVLLEDIDNKRIPASN